MRRLPPRPLLVLHEHPRLTERLRALEGRHFQYHRYRDWASLAEALPASPSSAIAIVDPYHPDRARPAAALRELAATFPSATIAAALVVAPESGADLALLGKWGISEIIAIGHDDTRQAIEARLRRIHARHFRQALALSLPVEASGHARALVDAAARVVAAGGNVTHLAAMLQLSPRTLTRWCERVGVPPARTLLAWLRVLIAAQRLDDPNRTVRDVAESAGYSSDTALRRVMVAFVGMNPTALRAHGAYAAAERRFRAVMATHLARADRGRLRTRNA